MTELCLQLTVGSWSANGDKHLELESCEMMTLLTIGDFAFYLCKQRSVSVAGCRSYSPITE